MLYLDTSALLPYYRPEPLSERVQDLLLSADEPVIITDLGRVEVASALSRLVRMDELSEQEALVIEGAFEDDIAESHFSIRALKPREFNKARKWLESRATALRTLDALHLASASLAGATFVTADASLRLSAEHFGVPYRLLEA